VRGVFKVGNDGVYTHEDTRVQAIRRVSVGTKLVASSHNNILL
jgi:hypothetical protein